MENEKLSMEPGYPCKLSKSEKDDFEEFITVMVQIVEKYGKIVLKRLDHVA
ncbi:hypothetical protein [Pseudoramibacter alactolyticus]|jgi:hypothetical protein|uniref:hypothetical protein n=1 Tax=Pseudoramibacter alactolyticus TaxID=113287 RepID=UPI0028E5DB2B|nr:hypothetical protein [Pseudoramibacter alactolyticus]